MRQTRMLPKAYDPQATEDRIYEMWENSGAFSADVKSTKKSFTISMPPPNATGQLHLGHAVMLALEDIFIRFARMRGKEALWVPGTDHAAIATEAVVIREVQEKERIPDPRASLGREELIRRIMHFVENSQGTIRRQVRKMGTSCDWSREKYTMDPSLARCTNEVFKDMYETGVMYRGHRIVNWDPKMQTTVSDDEIERRDEKTPFYTFQYGPFQISTARPETKFGDKYVVMHPDDKRYKKYKHGDTFEAEWINGKVTATVIKDKAIDPEFGTGVMTITPWHDATDFEIAQRHDLDKEQIIDYEGKLLPIAGEFAGMPIEEARPQIVTKLKEKGLLVGVDENYVHAAAISYRGGGKIEPQIKEQWFVDVNKKALSWKAKKMSIKEVMQDVVHSGLIRIIPERFEKTYFQWIDNLRDWCVSRQIWWGHRIPVWYRAGETYVGPQPPEGEGWARDPDTLDTWFGVAMWTWATLVDEKLAQNHALSLKEILEKSPDVRKFHPTQVMETGYDILFFWVARMILMTTYTFSRFGIGKDESERIPFQTVYLHGLIRTRDGKKMSKSHPETMIDPLDMIAKYGADALRLSMIVGQSPGNDSKLYEEKIAGYRNFVNKLWNASRFVLMQCEEAGVDPSSIVKLPAASELSLADRAVLHASELLIEDVTDGLVEYRLSEVGERLYSFVWDYFCDWYLELSKGNANLAVLIHVLRRILKLLHPYCPFVTEELWAGMKPSDATLLILEEWPKVKNERKDQEAWEQFDAVIDFVEVLREHKAAFDLPDGGIIFLSADKKHFSAIKTYEKFIQKLAKISEIHHYSPSNIGPKPLYFFGNRHKFQGYIHITRGFDSSEEKMKLTEEKERLERQRQKIEQMLSNAEFSTKAPPEVIQRENEKLSSAKEKIKRIDQRLKSLPV